MTPLDVFARAQGVADAVLWEGYVLYPYRASAAKNQVRWQYGVLTPRRQSELDGYERWAMHTQCVAEVAPGALATVRIRYLQVQRRTVEVATEDGFTPVAELEVDGELWASWDEAVEHTLDLGGIDVTEPGVAEVPIRLDAGLEVSALGASARVARERWAVDATVRVERDRWPGPYPLVRVRVTVENHTDWCDPDAPRDHVIRRSLVGVHALLHVEGGRFLSLLEPPEFARPAVESCHNDGAFPVLVGDPADPTTVLSSPIILYDHPAVAAESPGDMCDATEIDEILALRILTLTDDEKRLARSTDPRAAAIVDRIEAFTPEVFAGLHGQMRPTPRPPEVGAAPPGPMALPWWEPAADAAVDPWSDSLTIAGTAVARGSKVRLRPGTTAGRRTDAQDLFLTGMTATVEAVFLDVDGEHHVAVTLDEDPAADLHQWHGRFLYFHPDEVEPVT